MYNFALNAFCIPTVRVVRTANESISCLTDSYYIFPPLNKSNIIRPVEAFIGLVIELIRLRPKNNHSQLLNE